MNKDHQQRQALEFWHVATRSLRRWARDESFKARFQRDVTLRKVLRRAASRHVAGDNASEALALAGAFRSDGVATTIDFAGENESHDYTISAIQQEYLQLIGGVAAAGLPTQLSLDLSQFGLTVHRDIAVGNVWEVVQTAQASGVEVVLNMEQAALVDSTIHVYQSLWDKGAKVGITLQAHLFRTPSDLERVMEHAGKIRLVKGAYTESSTEAWPRGSALDRAYLDCAAMLLRAEHPCAIATHDVDILKKVGALANKATTRPPVEAEVLHGTDAQLIGLARELGFPPRVFLTYGSDWLLYFCHRLAEHPFNLIAAIEDGLGIGVNNEPSSG